MRPSLAALAALAIAALPAPARAQGGETDMTILGGALRPSVLAEVDYRAYPSEVEGSTGFALARLRPGLVLRPVPWFDGVVIIELASEHVTVMDAFLRLTPDPGVQITIGHSKPPLFPSFVYEPVHTLPFPDRAPVVTAFRVRRDLGVDLHLAPRAIPFEGWVRVGNGTGSPLGNDNALPAGYLSLDLVLGRAWAGAPADPDPGRAGLRLGVGGLIESARDRDGITGTTPLGFVHHRPTVVSGVRAVGEAHAVAYAGPVRVTVEMAAAHEERSRDDDGNVDTPRVDLGPQTSTGMTAEVAWVVRGMPRQVGRAPTGTPPRGGGWTGGALELAGRLDAMWIGRGAEDVDPGGSRGVALALKWWPVEFLAGTLAGYVTWYEAPPLEDPLASSSRGVIGRASFFWGR